MLLRGGEERDAHCAGAVKLLFCLEGAVPEYLAPGIYVEEVAFRAKSIEGVSTSTSSFVGAHRGRPHPEGEWKYVEVRRTLLFIEESIDRGTQWTVFEPDGERLWSELSDAIASFLEVQWKRGFLVGETRDEAYFVRCERTGLSESDIDNGHVVIEVGVAPERPGYFEVFHLRRATADAFPSETALPELPFALTTNEGRVIGVFARARGLDSSDVGKDDKRSSATVVLKEGRTDFAALRAWVQALRAGENTELIVTERGRRRWRLARGRRRWRLERGQIVKWKGPNLNAKGNEVAIEELEIAHEGLKIEDGDEDDND